MKIIRDKDNNIIVSGPLAIVFLMLLSFLVAWYTVSASQGIVDKEKNSPIFNVNERIKKNGVQLK